MIEPMWLPIEPFPKPRMTQRDRWKKRPVVVKYFNWKDRLRALAKQHNLDLGHQYTIIFYVPMPPSWSEKKKKAHEGQPHQARPDWDNYAKAFQDALCDEDSAIWNVHTIKVWARVGAIYVAPTVPITPPIPPFKTN